MLVWRSLSRRQSRQYAALWFSSSWTPPPPASSTSPSTTIKKRLDVAIVGLPNAGKSQLLNLMTKQTFAAVSRKRHTTREGIMGTRIIDDSTQLLFVDTPGFLRTAEAKREGLERSVMTTAKRELLDVDFTLLVVDGAMRLTDSVKATIVELMMGAMTSKGRKESMPLPPPPTTTTGSDEEDSTDDSTTLSDDDEDVLAENEQAASNVEQNNDNDDDDNENGSSHVKEANEDDEKVTELSFRQKFAVVLNKTDLVHPKNLLLGKAMELSDMAEQVLQYRGQTKLSQPVVPLDHDILMEIMPTFFYTDCRKNEGVDDIVNFLKEKATPCKDFELDMTPQPEERAEEIIREKIYRCLHKEVPYHVRQNNRLFRVVERSQGQPEMIIAQDLIVQTKSHLKLIQGKTLEVIRKTAERDMIKSFLCPVSLQLTVRLAKSSERTWAV